MQVTTSPTPTIPTATPRPAEHRLPEPNVVLQATIPSTPIDSSCPSTTLGVVYLNNHFNSPSNC